MGKKYGISFSFKRLIGYTYIKQLIARRTGIPLTKIGFNAKLGRSIIRFFFKK